MSNNNENRCLYCANKPIFKLNIDLIKHIKLRHSIVDNNLYTCLYGLNDRCSSLISSDKLTQKDFDDHIIKSHLILASDKINQSYESFNKSFGLLIQ
jgi:hypothetical protein